MNLSCSSQELQPYQWLKFLIGFKALEVYVQDKNLALQTVRLNISKYMKSVHSLNLGYSARFVGVFGSCMRESVFHIRVLLNHNNERIIMIKSLGREFVKGELKWQKRCPRPGIFVCDTRSHLSSNRSSSTVQKYVFTVTGRSIWHTTHQIICFSSVGGRPRWVASILDSVLHLVAAMGGPL